MMNHKFNWLSGFLTGGAIGATVAILSAPRSGEETRTMIREKTMEVREGAVQALEDGRSRLEDVTDDLRHRITNLKIVGQDVLDEEKDLIEKSAGKARKAVKGRVPVKN